MSWIRAIGTGGGGGSEGLDAELKESVKYAPWYVEGMTSHEICITLAEVYPAHNYLYFNGDSKLTWTKTVSSININPNATYEGLTTLQISVGNIDTRVYATSNVFSTENCSKLTIQIPYINTGYYGGARLYGGPNSSQLSLIKTFLSDGYGSTLTNQTVEIDVSSYSNYCIQFYLYAGSESTCSCTYQIYRIELT